MNHLQRITLVLGFVGCLHSSMVPPVNHTMQPVAVDRTAPVEACRYHEFTERSLPFTRGYEVANANVGGLLAEWGIIAGITGGLFTLFGGLGRANRENQSS